MSPQTFDGYHWRERCEAWNANSAPKSRDPNAVHMRVRIPTKISTQEAIALQERLAPLVSETSELPSPLTRLVGCDATYFGAKTLAAATLVDYNTLHLLKIKMAMERTSFPYVPGLLAFREAPVVLRAIRALGAKSFVCLVDAHGLAHPAKVWIGMFRWSYTRPTYDRCRQESSLWLCGW